jgi:hypothetical protein
MYPLFLKNCRGSRMEAAPNLPYDQLSSDGTSGRVLRLCYFNVVHPKPLIIVTYDRFPERYINY